MRTLEIDGRQVQYRLGNTSVGYVVSMDARAETFPFPRVGDVERIGRRWRAVVGPTSDGRDHDSRAATAPTFRTMREAVECIVRSAMPADDPTLEAGSVEGPFDYYGPYWIARAPDGSTVPNEHGRPHHPTRESAEMALVDPPSTGHPTEQDPPLSYADHRTYAVAMPISDDRLDAYSRRGVLLARDAAHEVLASISRDRHELLSRGGDANVEAAELLDSLRRRIMEAMR